MSQEGEVLGGSSKKQKLGGAVSGPVLSPQPLRQVRARQSCKQFWKAGDYEGAPCSDDHTSAAGGIDHVRVHPRFLHSNATSHKWALGAFAELLDNALDEVCSGATYVNVDVLENKKDGSRMLLIQDDGGGMDPSKMRHCMSLGYSVKSKIRDTIGQYGNGFKTSTMRLGADVIVFSRCEGIDGKSDTRSIGLLSYTFLKSTGKEDIVVPMLDYERRGGAWSEMFRSSERDWKKNVETIVQWSPFSSEEELHRQFLTIKNHGTQIIIYNLWEDDEDQLELDFDTDPNDIQLRGVNRDEKNIQMAQDYPNSRVFLTYQHSLRSYASILYLRLPSNFRIILRGKEVEHHNIVNDMMMSQQVTYRPTGADGNQTSANAMATVTIGFVKDAESHIDVQGFNVYHKNRLIKPFWRLWNAAGSDGRGVMGVLEANFVEPAHDKQGFERTTVLSRLEKRLIHMQKDYWGSNCHKIGYARRRNKKIINDSANLKETSPDPPSTTPCSKKRPFSGPDSPALQGVRSRASERITNDRVQTPKQSGTLGSSRSYEPSAPPSPANVPSSLPPSPANVTDADADMHVSMSDVGGRRREGFAAKEDSGKDRPTQLSSRTKDTEQSQHNCSPSSPGASSPHVHDVNAERSRLVRGQVVGVQQLKTAYIQLKKILEKKDQRCKSLETQLLAAQQKITELNNEEDTIIGIFSEERERRDKEEKSLREKLKNATDTIQQLQEQLGAIKSA
ncbi:unnamed protein product [Malus baccata var. baccata]